MFKKFKKNEHGFTLVELVVGVGIILALAVGGVAMISTGINKQIHEQDVSNALTLGHARVLDAETNFDETTNADTVIEDLNSEHEDITFRHVGAGSDTCLYAEHQIFADELYLGDCEEAAPQPEPTVYETVSNLRCRGVEPSWVDFRITWEPPADFDASNMLYEVVVSETDGETVVDTTSDAEYFLTVPDGDGTTKYTITPIIDGERLDSMTMQIKNNSPDTPRFCDNTRLWTNRN